MIDLTELERALEAAKKAAENHSYNVVHGQSAFLRAVSEHEFFRAHEALSRLAVNALPDLIKRVRELEDEVSSYRDGIAVADAMTHYPLRVEISEEVSYVGDPYILPKMLDFCSRCGEPYHRYSPEDTEHKSDSQACINALRDHVGRLEAQLAEALVNTKDYSC